MLVFSIAIYNLTKLKELTGLMRGLMKCDNMMNKKSKNIKNEESRGWSNHQKAHILDHAKQMHPR